MIDDNIAAAHADRANRVIRCSKHSAHISQVVDNITISVKIEAKKDNHFDIKAIKQQITETFNGCTTDTVEVSKRIESLFFVLYKDYNDNKISITVLDSDNCGFATNYYNTIPQSLIKV
jgi:hypothetical protein